MKNDDILAALFYADDERARFDRNGELKVLASCDELNFVNVKSNSVAIV